MKKLTLLPLFALLLVVFNACKSEPPPPPEPLIERNPEVRRYIDVLTDLTTEYCALVEETLVKAEEMEKKQEAGEVSFLDGVDMLSGVATSVIKIKNLSDEIASMEVQKEDFQKTLSGEDFKEFLALYTNSLTCFYSLAEKAEKLTE